MSTESFGSKAFFQPFLHPPREDFSAGWATGGWGGHDPASVETFVPWWWSVGCYHPLPYFSALGPGLSLNGCQLLRFSRCLCPSGSPGEGCTLTLYCCCCCEHQTVPASSVSVLPGSCPVSPVHSQDFYLFTSQERGMEGERERNINVCEIYRSIASHMPPIQDLGHNPHTCPDWKLNLQPFLVCRPVLSPLSHTSQGSSFSLWFACLQVSQYTNHLGMFVWWTGNPSLSYSCPTYCSFKGRDLDVPSCHHAADATSEIIEFYYRKWKCMLAQKMYSGEPPSYRKIWCTRWTHVCPLFCWVILG